MLEYFLGGCRDVRPSNTPWHVIHQVNWKRSAAANPLLIYPCCLFSWPRVNLLRSLEQRNLELETEMVNLHEELDQERKKYTMAEIKLRNAERAKDDAERRNQMLQKEMEQFFSTFSDLTATGAATATDPRRPDRNNPIWIQWSLENG